MTGFEVPSESLSFQAWKHCWLKLLPVMIGAAIHGSGGAGVGAYRGPTAAHRVRQGGARR